MNGAAALVRSLRAHGATCLGVASRRVEHRQDLAAALDWALAERRPALLDIVVDEGDEGSAA